jgi:hypothetical protein
LVAIAIDIFVYAVYRRYRLWRLGGPDSRLDNLWGWVKALDLAELVESAAPGN